MSKVVARDHEAYGLLTVIALLFPIVGFIVGIVYLAKDRKVDRKLGEHLLAFSVLAFLFWLLFFGLVGAGTYQ